jgi:hypothetical protein
MTLFLFQFLPHLLPQIKYPCLPFSNKGFVRSYKLLLLFSVAVPEELTGGTKESDGLLVGA